MNIKNLVKTSHQLQFDGMDYQEAAYQAVGNLKITDDQMTQIQSSPEPGCDCGFCKTAEFE